MSYPNVDDPDFRKQILRKKEYINLKGDFFDEPSGYFYKYRDPDDQIEDPVAGKYHRLHSHQLFVRNIMNPNTPNFRLHLEHMTGTGKTLAAVSIAQEFIQVYSKLYAVNAAKSQAGRKNYPELDRMTPSVFVFAFAGKAAFVRELLKHPEFGFISVSEREELTRRMRQAGTGLPDDLKSFKEYHSFIKKRITNKTKDGFYKFYGYDEFVNRLFLSDEIKLTDLEAIAGQKRKDGSTTSLEDIINEYIANGKIQVNMQLLSMFENSLLICDEIHNTYNMNMKNNRGVAIQYLLDKVPNLRFLSLTATPINNSPTEAVELINYLVPPDKKITKKEFFTGNRTLLPGKLEELGRLSAGHISFLQDVNLKYYPKRIFEGESIVLPEDIEGFSAGEIIPYLKFIQCPMSQIHQETLNSIGELGDEFTPESAHPIKGSSHSDTDINEDFEPVTKAPSQDIEDIDDNESMSTSTRVPTDGYTIYDMVLPNPDSDTLGLFKSGETRAKIAAANQNWKDKNKIYVQRFTASNYIFSGEFLTRANIGKWSSKYAKLLDNIFEIIAESGGDPAKCQKSFIYHNRVKMSGVLMIQELLKANGILDEHSEPTDNTICCVCGKPLSAHIQGKTEDDTTAIPPTNSHIHTFTAARFVMAHSDIEKSVMEQSLTKYNNADNAHGLKYMFLLGSKIIKESFDFKDIQNIIITSLPINIPTTIQVLGRGIRKGSHANLPLEQRRVQIRFLVSVINPQYAHKDTVAPEIHRYAEKLADYMVIQKIEREFNRNAIDADIHRDIIMQPAILREYFGDDFSGQNTGNEALHARSSIGNLYFEPAVKVDEELRSNPNLISKATFKAYRYWDEEIDTITWLIKRLFIHTPVWTYDDLWKTVRAPPISVEVNPMLFDEDNFIIALNNLVQPTTTIMNPSGDIGLVERLFDSAERYIYHNGKNKIEHIGEYYIMFPVVSNDIIQAKSHGSRHYKAVNLNVVSREQERNIVRDLVEPNDRVMIDVETYIRPIQQRGNFRIDINAYLRGSKANSNYIIKKEQFMSRPFGDDFLYNYSADFQMAFIEEAISGQEIIAGSADKPRHPHYQSVINLIRDFGVVVTAGEVAKYKDVVKQYGEIKVPNDTPIGYTAEKSVRLYSGRWFEVNKIALNRHPNYKENDITIGYFESSDERMKFKLRKPVQKLDKKVDTRTIEKGIVCDTKNKSDLMQILANLGVSVSKLDRGEIRIKGLCGMIQDRLLVLERKERGRLSRYKYLYSWWDEQPALG